MRPERGVPATPRFWSELEEQLRARASGRARPRLPVATTALRALRSLTSAAVHVLAASGLAVLVLLAAPSSDPASTPTTVPEELGSQASFAPPLSPTVEELAATAAARGHEVTITRAYVDDHRHHGEVLEIRHPGSSRQGLPPARGVKGPVVIVVGMAVSEGGVFAT